MDRSHPENVHHCCLLLLSGLCRMVGPDPGARVRSVIGDATLRSPSRGSLATQHSLSRRSSNTNLSAQVAVLDVVWACVVPDRKNMARFLVEDCMDALLTLLEVGNRGHRAVALSLPADILANPRSHSFFHEWRSHQDQSTAAHLLLRIWKEEDQASGISDPQGILTSTHLPLRGTGKPTAWVVPEAITYGDLLPQGSPASMAMQHLSASAGPLTVRVPLPTGFGTTARLVATPNVQLTSTSPRSLHASGWGNATGGSTGSFMKGSQQGAVGQASDERGAKNDGAGLGGQAATGAQGHEAGVRVSSGGSPAAAAGSGSGEGGGRGGSATTAAAVRKGAEATG